MNKNFFNCRFRCKKCGFFQQIEFYYKNNSPLINNSNEINLNFYPPSTKKNIFKWKDNILCLKVLSSNNLAIGNLDCSIYILDETLKEIINIKQHTKGVLFIEELKNKNIASCSSDCTIKIFKLLLKEKDYELIQNINFNNNTIFKVFQLSNENLFSCCEDKTLIEWKLEKNSNKYFANKIFITKECCENAIEINYNNNNNLFENKKEIVSCSNNENCLYFWDLDTKENIKIKKIKNSGTNTQLVFYNNEILLIGGIHYIYYINVKRNKEHIFKYKINYHAYVIKKINNYLLIGDEEGNLHKLKFINNEFKKIGGVIDTSLNYITSIDFNKKNIFVSSYSITLKKYNIEKMNNFH